MQEKLMTLYNYKNLLWEFIKKDIKLKYRNSILGVLWSMLNPLLIMLVLTFLFSNIFKNAIPNFPVYCLSGRLIYDYFSQATNQCMNSITSKSSLIKKIYVPKFLYPLSKAISTFIIFLISIIPLIGIMIVTHVKIGWIILLTFYPLICLLIISFGIGLILATINVFFRDIQHLYSIVLMIIMYASAIFYSIDIINPKYAIILNLNPIFPVIKVFRDCILYGRITAYNSWWLSLVYSIISIICGTIIFCKKQDKFVFHI
ncbi:ABC transporter permease [uncultured Clostridium sp.]|uniref:ABC transporter permease n=1 Tax=uncultured Clostridium sp. TaxID=59620 RepID=UPI0026013909|nr:ABC transporter permease [uncultured Clostridium sp.]